MRLLIADDDASTRYLLELFCRHQNFQATFAGTGAEALEQFEKQPPDLVVTDVRMPDLGGENVLRTIKGKAPDTPVLIMTAHGSIDEAVRFLKLGADDYIAKPVSEEVFVHRVKAHFERLRLARELEELRASRDEERVRIIGSTPPMQALLSRLPMTAQTDAAVVVYGESGTGKELVAEKIHELSKRADHRFVTVNCGALADALLESELFGYKRGAFTDAHRDTPGLVEEAEHGTLFLDEIGEISHAVQVKLLRFLQSKEYKQLGSPKVRHADVRIVAATNRDLKAMVDQGTFREDLYYRLNIVPLVVPPLRARRDDIPILAMHFLQKFKREFGKDVKGFSPEVMARMKRYDWPGNVRQLENKVQQMVVLATGSTINTFDLDVEASADIEGIGAPAHHLGDLGTYRDEKRRALDRFERDFVQQKLDEADGNLSEAARLAGLDRKNFWVMAKKVGLWPLPRRASA